MRRCQPVDDVEIHVVDEVYEFGFVHHQVTNNEYLTLDQLRELHQKITGVLVRTGAWVADEPDPAVAAAMNICHDLHEGHVPGCGKCLTLEDTPAARLHLASIIREQ